MLGFSLNTPRPSPASSYTSSTTSSTILTSVNSASSHVIPPPFKLESQSTKLTKTMNGKEDEKTLHFTKNQVNITPRSRHGSIQREEEAPCTMKKQQQDEDLTLSPPGVTSFNGGVDSEDGAILPDGFGDDDEINGNGGEGSGGVSPASTSSLSSLSIVTNLMSSSDMNITSSPSRTQVVRAFEEDKSDDDEEEEDETTGGGGYTSRQGTHHIKKNHHLSVEDPFSSLEIKDEVVLTPQEGSSGVPLFIRKKETSFSSRREFSPGSPRRQGVTTPAQSAIRVKVISMCWMCVKRVYICLYIYLFLYRRVFISIYL